MTLARGIAGAGGWLLAGLVVSGALAAPSMRVEVALDDLASGELHVSILLQGNEDPHLRLTGVPTYVDNPVAEGRGEVVRHLRVSSAQEDIPVKWSRGERGEPIFGLTGAGDEVLVEYTLRVSFVAGPMVRAYPIQIPFLDAGRGWLVGNHVFLTPRFSDDRVADLRTPCPVELEFVLPPGVEVCGAPARTSLRNLYELLSLQFGIGEFRRVSVEGGPWPGELLYPSSEDFSPAELEFAHQTTSSALDLTATLFGGVPFPSMSVALFRRPGMGGLEGAFACQVYLPEDLDLAGAPDRRVLDFQTVLVHEVVHAWLPIALFARDDPWFKEGVTSYYGNVLAARAGWMGTAEVEQIFATYADRLNAATLEPVPLSDPRIWYEEYSAESWRRLTYDRGHAVAALLDVHLREAGGAGLDAVMPVLAARFTGRAFSRSELLAAIREATGVDAGEFFAQHVDTATAPTAQAVAAMHRRAIELGIYGPG